MFGIVVLMMAASTVFVILGLRSYTIQVPKITKKLSPHDSDVLRSQLYEYNIVANWMSRLNVSISVCA